jgi:hypothetical protein
MIVWGTMDVGLNNVIYMELHSGPKIANGTCGKTIVAGMIDRGSTVYSSNEIMYRNISVKKIKYIKCICIEYIASLE